MKSYLSFFAALLFVQGIEAQIDQKKLDQLSLQYAKASFDELAEFFSLPNDAYYPEQIEPNVRWCEKANDSHSWVEGLSDSESSGVNRKKIGSSDAFQ